MTRPRVPAASYRLQFNGDFGFADAGRLVPYLHELGITDLYASPLFAAGTGSPHGYDVTDPTRLNPALGEEADFEALCGELQERGMGLLLDIVPNHMAASTENGWWRDVLRRGRNSPYASFFDIDWQSGRPGLSGKVLLPVLGGRYGGVLESGELRLEFGAEGFSLRYHERSLPVNPASVEAILTEWSGTLIGTFGLDRPLSEADLWQAYGSRPEVRAYVDEQLRALNGEQGNPSSFDRLDRLLSEQAYRPAFWRVAAEEINYRRFFDVSDLVSLRMEDNETFETTHALVFRLARSGLVTGLRIDHIDGLYDPEAYLTVLQARLTGGDEPAFFILVEKILGENEELPSNWPVLGTTGYDYLNTLNELFVDREGSTELTGLYERFSGCDTDFGTVAYTQKKRVMQELFTGEVRSLAAQLGPVAAADRHGRDLTRSELERALVEVTACLPVYRTYIRDVAVSGRDRSYIERAVEEAVRRCPAAGPACDLLQRVLLMQFPPTASREQRLERLRFVMRWQQFTGPIMAKGFEDTTLYIYQRLVSLNEVGGEPDAAGLSVSAFHRRNGARRNSLPGAMNATSTHDTKRSEDVRARISVLSEIPAVWSEKVGRWQEWNAAKKQVVNGQPVPDGNTELLIYQTLVGAWPLYEDEIPTFGERLRDYLVKAGREAKMQTSWLDPDKDYEDAVSSFVTAILDQVKENRFLADFIAFQRFTAHHGALNSLAQVLLKSTAPGFPDFYQGTELWTLTLVDPDNRRPVDFETRVRLLASLREREDTDRLSLVRELLTGWADGRVKLYLTYKVLHHRRAHQALFAQGDYIPVETTGPGREHVCAFIRRLGDEWVMTVVPRLTARLLCTGESLSDLHFPLGETVWGDTALILPENTPAGWRNLLTGEQLSGQTLALADVFRHFPVGLLAGERV